MDVKRESDRIFTLCQGCLSADRQLARLTDETKVLFIKLRNDFKHCEDEPQDLQLCWECTALLNKMKHFQARIKTAQYRLMCLHTLFKDDIHTLSSLTKTRQINKYDYKHKFTQSNKQTDRIPEEIDEKELIPEEKELIPNEKELIPNEKYLIPDEKEPFFNETELIQEKSERDDEYLPFDNIKQENDDSSIKEEYENSIVKELDIYLKEETEEYGTVRYKKRQQKSQSIKTYAKFATITQKNSLFKKVDSYSESVCLSEKEIEIVLKRDRVQVGIKYMPFKCENCLLSYKRRMDFLRHNALNHDNTGFPKPCSACKTQIHSRAELEEHWMSHTTMLRCTLCAELCRSHGEMKKHLNRIHTKIYTCNECQEECRSLREFSNHYKKTHEKVVCDYCNTSCTSKRRLESHIKRNHLPAYCTLCNKKYRSYHIFENHLRMEHPDLISSDMRKEMCYCVECDIQYTSIYKYRRHLQQSTRHKPKKIVRVPCPDCDKIFTRTSYMNNHYSLVHMKQSKHYCNLCNKYFANGYGVRKHIQHVHQKVTLPKDKICDICGRGFSTNRILTNHRRTHTGERPFKCPHCPASFAQKTAMKTHQKTQHKSFMECTVKAFGTQKTL